MTVCSLRCRFPSALCPHVHRLCLLLHIPCWFPHQVKARVLFCTHATSGAAAAAAAAASSSTSAQGADPSVVVPAIALSLSSALLRATPPSIEWQASPSAPPTKVLPGALFPAAVVERVYPGLGVLVRLAGGEKEKKEKEGEQGKQGKKQLGKAAYALVPLRQLSASGEPAIPAHVAEGKQVCARVLHLCPSDGLAIASLKGMAVKATLSPAGVQAGKLVTGTVVAVGEEGVRVQLAFGQWGWCPRAHMSEGRATHRDDAAFQPGASLQFRVLRQGEGPEGPVLLTHKKTLLSSKLPVLTSPSQATAGVCAHGWVEAVTKDTCTVHFYGDFSATIHREQEEQAGGKVAPWASLHVGQVLRCFALPSADAAHPPFSLHSPSAAFSNHTTLFPPSSSPHATPPPRALPNELHAVGSVIAEAPVVRRDAHSLVLALPAANGVQEAIMAVEHLADQPACAAELLASLRPGARLGPLLVLSMWHGCTPILTAKPALLQAAAAGGGSGGGGEGKAARGKAKRPQQGSYHMAFVTGVRADGACSVQLADGTTAVSLPFSPTPAALSTLVPGFSAAPSPATFFSLGQIVRAKILKASQPLQVALDPLLCASHDGSLLALGEQISGRVVDVGGEAGRVVLAVGDVAAPQPKSGSVDQMVLVKGTRLLVRVLLATPHYAVVSLPACCTLPATMGQSQAATSAPLLATLAGGDFNLPHVDVPRLYGPGQIVAAAVVALPSPGTGGRIVLARDELVSFTHPSSGPTAAATAAAAPPAASSAPTDPTPAATAAPTAAATTAATAAAAAAAATACTATSVWQSRHAQLRLLVGAEVQGQVQASTPSSAGLALVDLGGGVSAILRSSQFPSPLHAGDIIKARFMAFLLSLSEIDKARAVAERALKTISYREEGEKLNIWVAYLNLENMHGNPPKEAVLALFQRGLAYTDPKKLHVALLGVFERSQQHDMADTLLHSMAKKFSTSAKVWLRYIQNQLSRGLEEGARKLLERALTVLPQRKHIKVISQAALMEYRIGSQERGRTLFESILRNFPKRTDLWITYIDQEVRMGDMAAVRRLFERVVSLDLPPKKMKSLLKKYLDFETAHGTQEQVAHVKARAVEYVQRRMGAGGNAKVRCPPEPSLGPCAMGDGGPIKPRKKAKARSDGTEDESLLLGNGLPTCGNCSVLQQRLDKAEDGRRKLREAVGLLRDRIEELTQTVATLQQDIRQQREENDELRQRVEQAEGRADEECLRAVKEARRAADALDEATRERERAEDYCARLRRLEREVAVLRTRVEEDQRRDAKGRRAEDEGSIDAGRIEADEAKRDLYVNGDLLGKGQGDEHDREQEGGRSGSSSGTSGSESSSSDDGATSESNRGSDSDSEAVSCSKSGTERADDGEETPAPVAPALDCARGGPSGATAAAIGEHAGTPWRVAAGTVDTAVMVTSNGGYVGRREEGNVREGGLDGGSRRKRKEVGDSDGAALARARVAEPTVGHAPARALRAVMGTVVEEPPLDDVRAFFASLCLPVACSPPAAPSPLPLSACQQQEQQQSPSVQQVNKGCAIAIPTVSALAPLPLGPLPALLHLPSPHHLRAPPVPALVAPGHIAPCRDDRVGPLSLPPAAAARQAACPLPMLCAPSPRPQAPHSPCQPRIPLLSLSLRPLPLLLARALLSVMPLRLMLAATSKYRQARGGYRWEWRRGAGRGG
ncbi:unnamed protein product [Closterium sp. Yama58-4]|nr:unnamed protein product [Closterium sp. Yama58-4]